MQTHLYVNEIVIHSPLYWHSGVSQYSEYNEENLMLEQDEHQTPLVSDDPDSHARRRAHNQHMERTRSSDSGMKENKRKRQVSKSDLQRQLSRQKSIEAVEKKVSSPEPTARTALILQEKVETGSVSYSLSLSTCPE